MVHSYRAPALPRDGLGGARVALHQRAGVAAGRRDAGGVQVTVTLDHAHMEVLVANLLMVSEGKGGANLHR